MGPFKGYVMHCGVSNFAESVTRVYGSMLLS